jgi:isopropylmalate/homocitrate/citramalate synthase
MVEIPAILNPEWVLRELSFDEEGRWAMPVLNLREDINPAFPNRRIIIKDDTFRESTNMPGAAPNNARKLELARKLEATGIKEIVGGHAGLKEQCDFMRMVKEDGLDLMVHAYVDFGDWKRGIENAVAAGADAIWMPGALNPSPIFAGKLGSRYGYWSADFDLSVVLDTMKAAIDVAKSYGKLITVARAPVIPGIFEKALDAYVKYGADRICIFDDRGHYTPQTMGYIVKMHRDAVGPDVKLEIHCHDDFGLSLANTLEAVRAGADVVDCVLNGYSHRSGNCSLEQIVPALEVLYGVKTGADLSQLTSLCQLASDVFGVPIPPQRPHVGESVYAYGGVHISALLQEGWFVWETINAEAIGQKRHVVWSPTALERHGMAGPVALKIRRMGLEFNEAQLEQVFAAMRKVMATKNYATDEELEAVVQQVLGK